MSQRKAPTAPGSPVVVFSEFRPRASKRQLLDRSTPPPSYWREAIPWYPGGCFGPYRSPAIGYSRRELLADGVLHIVGLASSLVATIYLLSSLAPEVPKAVAQAVTIYCASLCMMLTCSSLFNGLAAVCQKQLRVLQLLDHAGILFLICGSYTPMMTLACEERLLQMNWGLAICAFTVKATRSRLDRVSFHVPIFLVMGWSVLSVWTQFWEFFSPWAKQQCIIAGAMYTLGLLPWACNRIEGHNVLWHIFVWTGSAIFFDVVLREVSVPSAWVEKARSCVSA